MNFGALTAFLVLHVTVIWHFFIKKRDGKVFAHLISPLIGFAVIAYTWVSLSMPAKLLGISWVAIGIVYYLVMRKVLKREVTLA